MLAPKSSKKRKSESLKNEVITKGEIELLRLFQSGKQKSFILMEISENMEIALSFEITLENPPEISSILSIQINSFYNFDISRESAIEACVRFPHDGNFRAVMMKKSNYPQEISSIYLLDDSLDENHFELNSPSSKIELEYENFQTKRGLKFFHQLIENKQNLLMEFRIDGKMMMTFIDLDVFNYPGVCDVTFFSPLYEWNKGIIKELFQQEACLKDENISEKKARKISKKVNEHKEPQSLVPIIFDGKHAAIRVRIKFSTPQTSEDLIEDLIVQLNEKFQFIANESLVEKSLKECDENFKLIIEELAQHFEEYLNENPDASEREIKIEMINHQKELKEVIKALIGNVYNLERKTKTNHEFKLLMMDVFKELKRKMMKILNDKWVEDEKPEVAPLDFKLRRNQIEEWIIFKNRDKVEEILSRELKNYRDIKQLEELAIYQFKLGNLFECEALEYCWVVYINAFNIRSR